MAAPPSIPSPSAPGRRAAAHRRGGPRALAALTALALGAAEGPAPGEREAPPLSLGEAVRAALRHNERTRLADETRAAAEARLRRARSYFFPSVALAGSYTRRDHEVARDVGGDRVVIQDLDALQASASATVTLIDAGALPLYRAARLERRGAALAADDERRRLGFDVAIAFVATLGQEQVLAAARRRLALARETTADSGARRAAGLVGDNDVTKAALEEAVAGRELARAGGALEEARVALGLLVGAPLAGPLSPPEELLAAPGVAVARAPAGRLDLAAAHARAEAAMASAEEPLRRALPTVDLRAQYRVTNEAGFAGRSAAWSAGLDLTWALFDGGARYAERDERLALARIAALEEAATRRGADAEVARALAAHRAAQAAAGEAATAAAAAARNADEVRLLYRQGLAGALEVTDAAARAYDADVALLRDRYDQARALLELRAAAGQDALGHPAAAGAR